MIKKVKQLLRSKRKNHTLHMQKMCESDSCLTPRSVSAPAQRPAHGPLYTGASGPDYADPRDKIEANLSRTSFGRLRVCVTSGYTFTTHDTLTSQRISLHIYRKESVRCTTHPLSTKVHIGLSHLSTARCTRPTGAGSEVRVETPWLASLSSPAELSVFAERSVRLNGTCNMYML